MDITGLTASFRKPTLPDMATIGRTHSCPHDIGIVCIYMNGCFTAEQKLYQEDIKKEVVQ